MTYKEVKTTKPSPYYSTVMAAPNSIHCTADRQTTLCGIALEQACLVGASEITLPVHYHPPNWALPHTFVAFLKEALCPDCLNHEDLPYLLLASISPEEEQAAPSAKVHSPTPIDSYDVITYHSSGTKVYK